MATDSKIKRFTSFQNIKLSKMLLYTVVIFKIVGYATAQEEGLNEVTYEMFEVLQQEILLLNNKLGVLQEEVLAIATRIEGLATETAVVGSVELAELQELITVSNKQEDDISKLLYLNGIWRQNFRTINITFEKLQKTTALIVPVLTTPLIVTRPKMVLSMINGRTNVTLPTGSTIKRVKMSDLKLLKNITFPVIPRKISNNSGRNINKRKYTTLRPKNI